MTRKALPLLALCAALLLPGVSNAEGGPGAIDAFRKADTTLRALADETSDPGTLRQKTDALLDYRTLATLSLGGPAAFKARCGARCPEYVALLTKVVRREHLQRLRGSGKSEYIGEVVGKSETVVKTRLNVPASETTPKRTQRVDYVMHKVHGTWQVRDIVTDGVRLSATYRREFDKLADKDGIGAVIGELARRLKAAP